MLVNNENEIYKYIQTIQWFDVLYKIIFQTGKFLVTKN